MLGCLVVVFMWLHVIFCRHEMNASSLDGLNTDPNQVVEGRTHAGFMTRFIACTWGERASSDRGAHSTIEVFDVVLKEIR